MKGADAVLRGSQRETSDSDVHESEACVPDTTWRGATEGKGTRAREKPNEWGRWMGTESKGREANWSKGRTRVAADVHEKLCLLRVGEARCLKAVDEGA